MNRSAYGFGYVAACCLSSLLLVENATPQFGGGRGTSSAQERLDTTLEFAAQLMTGKEGVSPNGSEALWGCLGSEGRRKIERVLDRPVKSSGLEFADQPLDDVISQLQVDYGIPIMLDTRALDRVGIGPDEPVTINLRDISLRSALRAFLNQLQLTYDLRDELLVITTPEEAERHLTVCVYDVRDLIGETSGMNVISLVDVIIACVATETWAANGGGEAEVRPLPPDMLVISQTLAVQDEIRDLFTTIRQMRSTRSERQTTSPSDSKNDEAKSQKDPWSTEEEHSQPPQTE